MFTGKVWLHRRIMNEGSPIWDIKTPTSCLKLFLFLIMRVNYRTVRKEGRTYQRGDYSNSLENISKEAQMSRPTVSKAIKWLKDKDYIDVVDTKQQYTHLRIKNYNIYQVACREEDACKVSFTKL